MMQSGKKGEAIRLTNKTAIALRRSAKREQTASMAAAGILTLALAALAVYLGLTWLWAVPLVVACAVLLDAAILLRAKSRYFMLTGQAICTEAAARGMREASSEQRRRERALLDLANMKEDALGASRAQREAPHANRDTKPMPALGQKAPAQQREERSPTPAKQGRDTQPAPRAQASGAEPAPAHRRRRRQAGFQVLRNEQAK